MPLAAFALTAAAALLTASPAYSQGARVCLPKAQTLIDQLGEEYGEVLTAAGVDANGNLVQVYSSDGPDATWTIAVTIPGGPTCVVSSGEGWSRDLAPAAPKGRPS